MATAFDAKIGARVEAPTASSLWFALAVGCAVQHVDFPSFGAEAASRSRARSQQALVAGVLQHASAKGRAAWEPKISDAIVAMTRSTGARVCRRAGRYASEFCQLVTNRRERD